MAKEGKEYNKMKDNKLGGTSSKFSKTTKKKQQKIKQIKVVQERRKKK